MRAGGIAYRAPVALLSLCAVRAAPAVYSAETEAVRLPGIASATFDAALGISLPGLVKALRVQPGDRVRAGDVLLELEDSAEKLEVERRTLVSKDRTELEAAQKKRDTLKRDLEVTRTLFETSRSVSREELEKRELEFLLSEADVKRLEVAEAREEIELRMATDALDRRRVRAPADGIVTKRYVEKGEYVVAQQPVMRLVNIDECYFTCNVPADASRRFEKAETLPVEFGLPAGPLSVEGRIVYRAPVVDPASGLREIRLRFVNRDHAVSPGEKGFVILK